MPPVEPIIPLPEAIRKIHTKQGEGYMASCREDRKWWPCPTIKAVNEAEANGG